MFSVRFEKPAEGFIEKVKDKVLLKRVMNKIDKLKDNPFPSKAVRVKKYKKDKVFRVRAGDYRILYYVNHEKSLIAIVNIDKRPRAY